MSENEKATGQEDLLQKLVERVEGIEAQLPKDELCIGVISGNLDTTMAAFIIALGAAAYDIQVNMFFTFWATAALRDPNKKVKKGFMDKMFGWMLPSGSKKLPLSKMQMGGIGPKMMQSVMKSKGAKSLEELMKEAAECGIVINVCTMSMEIMGISEEEMIDYPNMNFVGVGTFISMMSDAKHCFFL